MRALRREAAGVEQHAPRADRREVVLDLEVMDGDLPGDRLLQQRPQAGDVPLAVAEVVDEAALRLLLRDVERPVEGGVRRLDVAGPRRGRGTAPSGSR